MPAPIGTSQSRFKLESHDHSGKFVAALPYMNIQSESMLGPSAASLRVDIPYRGYDQVTSSNLYTGKHELWLYDNVVSDNDPIFAGPVWDITASSSSGVLACSAQDAYSYFTKRLLKLFKAYSAKTGTFMINDLVAYVNSIRAANIAVSIVTTSAQTSNQTYQASDRNVIADLIADISNLNDGTDFYMRNINGVHTLFLYGGRIKPTAKKYALTYGGELDGYSVQYNAQTIANDVDVLGANGLVGNATSATKKTEYNALYSEVVPADQSDTVSLAQTAAQGLKDRQSTKVIPSLVTRTKTPIKDFNFGDQFNVNIDDYYVQLNQTIRVVGWQQTISQGDKVTSVIYTKDTEGVS